MASTFRALVARLIARLIFRGPVTIGIGPNRFVFDPHSGGLVPVIAGGAPDDDEDDKGDADKDGAGDDDKDGEDQDGDDAADADKDGVGDDDKTDWKAMARKHERRAKAEKKRADELAAAQAERDVESQSDHEKALVKARDDATAEVTGKYETERRAERLELAVTRHATRGVKVGDETIKFADPDDAMAHLERAIKRGDVDGDDIFDEDGKVNKSALTEALAELLEDKPHLRATASQNGGGGRGAGDADMGKGKGAKGDESVADMIKRKQVAQR